MTTRQRFDHAILSITGHDIRLVGNWQGLPELTEHTQEIAENLNIPATKLRHCPDIAAVLMLMEDGETTAPSKNDPTLF